MQGANHYKQMSIKTANRGQILIMLYEGAIRNIRKAVDCMEKKDLAGKGMSIGKAHDIINELQATLDHSVGGKIAEDLDRLYGYMSEQLIQGNIKNTKEPLQNVEKLLKNLLDAWKIAVEQYNKSGTTATAPADAGNKTG